MATYAWGSRKELWDPLLLSIGLAKHPSTRGQGDEGLTGHQLPIVEHFPSTNMTGLRDCNNKCVDQTIGLEVV